MAPRMIRQGDVLLVETEGLPENAEKVEWEGRIVLAYGEVTGHAHAVALSQAAMYADGNVRYLRVADGGAELVHEEHATLQLAPGTYRIVHQREYSPIAPRTVID